MLKLFKSYNPYAAILIALLAIFFKLGAFMTAMSIHTEPFQFVWLHLSNYFNSVFGAQSYVYFIFTILNIVGQAIFLNRIANNAHIFPKNTYLPAMTYVLLTSLMLKWNMISAGLIGNWFMLGMLHNLLELYLDNAPRKKLFNLGLMTSLATLLSVSFSPLILFIVIAVLVLRTFNITELFIILLGLIMPYYFVSSYLFLTDQWRLIPELFNYRLFSLPLFTLSLPEIIGYSVMGVLFITGLFLVNNQAQRMLFQVKKMWGVILLMSIFSIVTAIFTIMFGYQNAILMVIPISLYITQIWFVHKPKWVASFIAFLLVAAIVFNQWFI